MVVMPRQIRCQAIAAAALLLIVLAGCIRKVSGTYKDQNNIMLFDFQSDGKAYARIMGAPVVLDYQESGSKIILKGSQGDAFLNIVDGNTLSIDHLLADYTGRIELKKQQ
jgi:hypothetical protein